MDIGLVIVLFALAWRFVLVCFFCVELMCGFALFDLVLCVTFVALVWL